MPLTYYSTSYVSLPTAYRAQMLGLRVSKNDQLVSAPIYIALTMRIHGWKDRKVGC